MKDGGIAVAHDSIPVSQDPIPVVHKRNNKWGFFHTEIKGWESLPKTDFIKILSEGFERIECRNATVYEIRLRPDQVSLFLEKADGQYDKEPIEQSSHGVLWGADIIADKRVPENLLWIRGTQSESVFRGCNTSD
jgi:hypothetical protein